MRYILMLGWRVSGGTEFVALRAASPFGAIHTGDVIQFNPEWRGASRQFPTITTRRVIEVQHIFLDEHDDSISEDVASHNILVLTEDWPEGDR